jgi:vancomycin resistance protein YoaR
MPERQTSSDAQGSDAEGSGAQESDVTGSHAQGSSAVEPGESSDGSGATRPTPNGAAPQPAPLFSPAPTAPAGPVPSADAPDPAAVEAARSAEPTEVIPRSGAADEVVGAVPAGAATGAATMGAGTAGAASTAAATTDVIAREALTEPAPEAEQVPSGAPADDPPTEQIPVVTPPPRPRRRALLLAGAAVVGLLVLLYAVDLVSSSGSVPRGVTVAGHEIGGLTHDEAEQRVRAVVESRTTQPVGVAVGDVTSDIDPKTAGLAVDWSGTIDRAGSQPLNPITRLRSFFTTREVGVATDVDDEALDSALQQLAPVVSKQPVEGTVRFEGVTPVPVPPVDGQELDLDAAKQTLEREWTSGERVHLPVRVLPPTTTQDDVAKAITDIATPAVSGPVTVAGEGVTGTISPEVIASALSFRADPNQGLVPELNREVVEKALDPQMASSEQPGRDATLNFVAGRPVVTRSQDGRGVDYDATLKDLLAVLTKTGDERKITAVYAAQPAKLTTEQLSALGINGVIGEFTTGGFAQDSGRNIKRAAEVINGMIVKPGETFSLNGATEPRDEAHGYLEAGIISEGHASRGVGGGVSQVATTLFNAAYFAGMADVTHKPHSFYISRYPPGREATVFEGAIDMKFKNDGPTGVMIQTAWTPASLTIRIYGTKRYDVTSATGPRTNPTEPTKVDIPAGQPCSPSQGAPGFTVTDTRTLRDVKTGAVKTERRTTKYNPSPIVTCGSE